MSDISPDDAAPRHFDARGVEYKIDPARISHIEEITEHWPDVEVPEGHAHEWFEMTHYDEPGTGFSQCRCGAMGVIDATPEHGHNSHSGRCADCQEPWAWHVEVPSQFKDGHRHCACGRPWPCPVSAP